MYVKSKISKGVTVIKTDNQNALWCKLDKRFFNLPNNIYLGTIYFSPRSYENSKSEDYIAELENDVAHFSCKGDVIIQGDFNARTGSLQEFIFDDENNTIFCESLPDDYIPDIPNLRQSLDSGTVDSRGSSLIEFCTENNFRILNWR